MTAPRPIQIGRFERALAQLWLLPQRIVQRRRLRRTVLEHVAGHAFAVVPDVMNPVVFRTGRYFAEFLADSPLVAKEAFAGGGAVETLDVGTGCGVLAVTAAARGHRVSAVDVSEVAVRCARANVLLNDFADRVEVLSGDLFAPVAGRRFDLVLCSLPKFRGSPRDRADLAWRSETVIDRFAAELPALLTPRGFALVLLTSHGDEAGMLAGLDDAGLACEPVARRHMGVEVFTLFRVHGR